MICILLILIGLSTIAILLVVAAVKVATVTLTHLLAMFNTLDQYSILQAADLRFQQCCGRYFGGRLHLDDITVLMEWRRR